MKFVHVMECSEDGKHWFRIWAMSKAKCVGNYYRYTFYKYKRTRILKVHNSTKIENLL